jgi:hypothetical protein
MSLYKKGKKAVRSTVDHIDRALESVADYSLHVKYFHREVSDVWRRDDRQREKYEDRAERDEATYQQQLRDNAYIREANAAARVSRMMYGSTRIGDAQSMTGQPLSATIGGGDFMNRYLGGGA